MGLPPIWTMFAVLFWGGVMGIGGILIGTPATAVIYRLLRDFVRSSLKDRKLDPNDPEFSDLLPEEGKTAPAKAPLFEVADKDEAEEK